MNKTVIWTTLLLYAGQFLVPALLVTAFFMERSRIERELCVQRERAADMRTCHGECHLMKQLKAAEVDGADQTPPQLPQRTQPEWFNGTALRLPETSAVDVVRCTNVPVLVRRLVEPLEHVPWC